jgi:hypothetical protein
MTALPYSKQSIRNHFGWSDDAANLIFAVLLEAGLIQKTYIGDSLKYFTTTTGINFGTFESLKY